MLNLILITLPSFECENKFMEIYNEYYKYMFGIASNFFKIQMDKEDAVYTSLFKIATNISKIDDVYSTKTKSFITIITKNTCITMLNKKNKIKEIQLDNLDNIGYDVDFEDIISNRETLLLYYEKCLKRLSKAQYEVLYLRYVNDLSLKEIATILDISQNTVKQRIYVAKQKLQSLIIEVIKNER